MQHNGKRKMPIVFTLVSAAVKNESADPSADDEIAATLTQWKLLRSVVPNVSGLVAGGVKRRRASSTDRLVAVGIC